LPHFIVARRRAPRPAEGFVSRDQLAIEPMPCVVAVTAWRCYPAIRAGSMLRPAAREPASAAALRERLGAGEVERAVFPAARRRRGRHSNSHPQQGIEQDGEMIEMVSILGMGK
jgi:hypothetical protein